MSAKDTHPDSEETIRLVLESPFSLIGAKGVKNCWHAYGSKEAIERFRERLTDAVKYSWEEKTAIAFLSVCSGFIANSYLSTPSLWLKIATMALATVATLGLAVKFGKKMRDLRPSDWDGGSENEAHSVLSGICLRSPEVKSPPGKISDSTFALTHGLPFDLAMGNAKLFTDKGGRLVLEGRGDVIVFYETTRPSTARERTIAPPQPRGP